MAGSPLLFILLAMFHLGRDIGRLLFLLLIVLPLLCVAAVTLETTESQHRKRNEISVSVSLSQLHFRSMLLCIEQQLHLSVSENDATAVYKAYEVTT